MTESTVDANAVELYVDLSNTQITTALERLAFQVLDPQGNPLPGNVKVRAEVLRAERLEDNQTMRHKIAEGEALRFGDSMPGGGAWVVYHDFDASGPWSLDTYVTFADGNTGFGRVDFEVQGRVASPREGERPPSVPSPVLSEGVDVSTISTDPTPLLALYQLSLDDALTNGKVTVVTFGSPATCPDCGTTLTQVKGAFANLGSSVNFVHIESADMADPDKPSPVAEAWGLPPNVPWTFVVNALGYVEGRAEGPISSSELELLVKRASGQ
jgi:hypothetical protein